MIKDGADGSRGKNPGDFLFPPCGLNSNTPIITSSSFLRLKREKKKDVEKK